MTKVCVYTICKNESVNLDVWFDGVRDADVVFILDTGSTDGTFERIQQLAKTHKNLHYAQKIYDVFEFDIARNDSLDFARAYLNDSEYLMMHIDLDEVLTPNCIEEVKKQWDPAYDGINLYAINVHNMISMKGHKNANDIRWFYAIHEKTMHTDYRPMTYLTIQNCGYSHYQDTTKERDYYGALKRAHKLHPHCIHYITYLVWEANLHNEFDAMKQYCREVIDEIFTNKEDEHYLDPIYTTHACIYVGDNEFADKVLDRIEKYTYDNDFKRYHKVRAQIADMLGNYEKARDEYIKAIYTPMIESWIESDVDNSELYTALGILEYYNFNNKKLAYYYFKRAYQLNPNELNKSNKDITSRVLTQEPDDKQKTWMTLLSNNDFIYGTVALIYGLRDIAKTKYRITVLVTNDVKQENIDILNYLGVDVLYCDRLIPEGYDMNQGVENLISLTQPGYHLALSKLNIYGLTDYKKIVYIDSDTYIRKNMDDLFDKPAGSAVEDVYGQIPDKFCSGLLVIEPNLELFGNILNYFYNYKPADPNEMIHDQAVLQGYFKDWGNKKDLHLDTAYHMWSTGFNDYDERYFITDNIKAFHMIDKKPWTINKQYYIDLMSGYKIYSLLTLEYIDFINYCIHDLNSKGVCNLKEIE